MANTAWDPVHLSLEFRWQPLGRVQLDDRGDLTFPGTPRQPGLYRFRLGTGTTARHYIGETDDLPRRFRHYRKPGPSQTTNLRMNELVRAHLAASGTVEIDIATREVAVFATDAAIHVDLADKTTRRLLEHAALLVERAAGVDMLNR